ncbi:MAG: cytochrome c [Lysobacterales bacterium]|jgi:mono/diheme cytochrome c family protein
MKLRQMGLPCISLILVTWMAAGAASADQLERGKEVFQVNCAVCHGPEGRPDPDSPVVQGLGVEPANFADALFNSREPVGDWEMVVTHGGAALAFSEQMPAFGEVLPKEDIDAVLVYIKTLGGEHDYPDGELNLFLPIRTKKAFPEDEWVWKQRYTGQEGDDSWKNVLEYEFRIGERAQGVLELTHETQGGDGEFGHFEPGFKYVLNHDLAAGQILTLGGNLGVPLNSGADWELLPYLAYGKILGDAWTFQGSGRLKLSLEDSDHSSAEFAGIVHYIHTPWPKSVFPALEVIAEVPFERGTGPGKKSAVQVSVLPQVRIGLNKRGHVALNVGAELPLNDTERYDWRGYVYLIWDFADGGFFEGW